MRIEVQNGRQKEQRFIKSHDILRYLITEDENISTLIMCKPNGLELITTDYNIYEALGSIKQDDSFRRNKLTKFFETVKVISYEHVKKRPKPVLTPERMDKLRKAVLEDKNGKKD